MGADFLTFYRPRSEYKFCYTENTKRPVRHLLLRNVIFARSTLYNFIPVIIVSSLLDGDEEQEKNPSVYSESRDFTSQVSGLRTKYVSTYMATFHSNTFTSKRYHYRPIFPAHIRGS